MQGLNDNLKPEHNRKNHNITTMSQNTDTDSQASSNLMEQTEEGAVIQCEDRLTVGQLKIAISGDGKPRDQTATSKFSVFQSISWKYWNRAKSKDAKIVWNVTKIISENNNRCTVNDFIFACSFILFFILSKSSNSYFRCDNLCRIHTIRKYFEFVSVHIQK